MKNIVIASFIFLTSLVSVNAQEWLTDIEEAKKIASLENHHIILVFQGSDWCAPCMKLDKEVWSTEEFKAYAKDHFILLEADFPRRKANKLDESLQAKNNQLAEKYNQEGYFPLVVVLDEKGSVLGKTGYENISTSQYIKLLTSY
jgi:thioredoxin-related protein